MDRQIFKRKLKEIIKQDEIINEKIRELEVDKKNLSSITAIDPSSDNVQSSNLSNPTEDMAIKIGIAEEEINEMIDELTQQKEIAKKYFKTLQNPLEIRVMELRYLKCYQWDEIAYVTEQEVKYIHSIHGYALNNIKLKDSVKIS